MNDTMEVNARSVRAFAKASLIFGILSMATLVTVFPPLAFGSMGILCAVLSKREGCPFPGISWWGALLSAIGLFIILAIMYFAIVNVLIPMYNDPAFYEEMKTLYQNTYGINLDDLMNAY